MARPKRKKRGILFALEVIILLVLVGGLYVYGQINSKMDKIQGGVDLGNVQMNDLSANSELLTGYTNIAVFGLDSREEGSDIQVNNSDTIILVSINNDTKEVKMVSVYRDTLVDIGNDSYQKCNAAYAAGGPEAALSMLNTNFDLNITEYVTVDMNAVTEVVDQLGGINLELTHDEVIHMNNYCEGTAEITGKTYTPIEPPEVSGFYDLNGVQATSYARIRYTEGLDFKRTERQRIVIQKLIEKAKQSSLSTLFGIMDKVFPMIETSISKEELLTMGVDMLSYRFDETTGFPFDHYESVVGDKGDVVIPITLKTNVEKLHKFLFESEAYTVSDEVVRRSDVTAKITNCGIETLLSIPGKDPEEAQAEIDAELAESSQMSE